MSYRFMRMLVFFDLPTQTAVEKKKYTKFRKLLISNGFLMMQESVYCKLLLNATAENTMLEILRKEKPEKGNVFVLTITEKQFSQIEYITGEFFSEVISTDDRMVII